MSDSDRIWSELDRLNERLNRHDKQLGEHTVADSHLFDRIDEKLADIDRRDADRNKATAKSTAQRIGLIGSIVVALGTAGVALYQSAVASGDEDATIRALVEKSRELDREIEQLRALLWRATSPTPFTPDVPALSGDSP